MAMSFGLLALYVALSPDQTGQTSFVCGTLAFLCFIIYNGYWPLAGFALLANILINTKKTTEILQKAIFTVSGFIIPLTLVVTIMQWLGTNMISAYRLFATSITQGSFDEGWSLPFAYFWYTEHTVILILGVLSILAVVGEWRKFRQDTKLWAAGILFIYLCLLIPSVFLHYFVVYGRLARQLIPLLVLLSAQGLSHIENRVVLGQKVTMTILALIFMQAAWNFISSYNLAYPREFVAEAQAKFPKFEFSSKRLAFGAPVLCQSNGYVMESAKYYVIPPNRIPQVQGRLLMSAQHPSNFRPYQYDGDAPATRKAFDRLKLRMNFYQVDGPFMSKTNPAWTTIQSCVTRKK
jgi:hypothetical protein